MPKLYCANKFPYLSKTKRCHVNANIYCNAMNHCYLSYGGLAAIVHV